MCKMKANGLELKKIKTVVQEPKHEDLELKENLDEQLKPWFEERFKKKSYIVSYLDYKVLIGTWENGKCHFHEDGTINPKYIRKLRLFNEDEELFVWRSSDSLNGRYRKDEEGDETDVVDAKQVLFGTDTDKDDLKDGFTRISEKRGTKIVLPFSGLDVKNKTEDKRVFVQTRNYIGYNDVHQATYIDCRFMGFWYYGKERT